MKLDILLTDGNYQNTYAILRALKKQKLKVGILYNYKASLSFFSRYTDKRFFIKSDISKNPDDKTFREYANELIEILSNNQIDVFLPVSNISFRFTSLYKNELEKYCKIPVVDHTIMQIAQDKKKTFEFAENNGIPIPFTIRLNNYSNLKDTLEKIPIPCVIKRVELYIAIQKTI